MASFPPDRRFLGIVQPERHALRPDGFTSADAAGLPIVPGLVGYDEVASGEITHALRMTMQHTYNSYIWPGRHSAGLSGQQQPPMGARIRLRTAPR